MQVAIIGSGGFGREAAQWTTDSDPDIEVVGYLDDDVTLTGARIGQYRVLGPPSWLSQHSEVLAVIGVGSPSARRAVFTGLASIGASAHTVVHPSAIIGRGVEIGSGSVICPGAVVTVDVIIGRAALLNLNATVGHDATVGDFAVLAPGVDVAGSVHLESGVDVGIGASIIQGLTVGEGTVIGGGACVTSSLPPMSVAVGIPARVVKQHGRW